MSWAWGRESFLINNVNNFEAPDDVFEDAGNQKCFIYTREGHVFLV